MEYFSSPGVLALAIVIFILPAAAAVWGKKPDAPTHPQLPGYTEMAIDTFGQPYNPQYICIGEDMNGNEVYRALCPHGEYNGCDLC